MSVKINYNEISKIYDDVRDEEVSLIENFLAEVELNETMAILDVGCGTGNYTNLMKQLTKGKVYGLDSSVGMLERAKNKNEEITFVLGNALEIPFSSRMFDFVYMTDVIHHIKDIKQMFTELFRILKPNGKICIMTQSHRQIDLRYMSEFFPQTAVVDKNRYPDIGEIIDKATKANLLFMKTQIVNEGIECKLDQKFLELVKKKGYSMLHLLDVFEYEKGLEKVKKEINCVRKSAGATLVWFKK